MKPVRLLAIEPGCADAQAAEAEFEVRVRIEVQGRADWHQITVRPRRIAGFDASLLVASEALQALFQDEQRTLHRICKLVGDTLRGSTVRVPQQIAA